MKIEIGSGEYPRLIEEGYIHSDIRYPLPHQELCFDLRYLPFSQVRIYSQYALQSDKRYGIPKYYYNRTYKNGM